MNRGQRESSKGMQRKIILRCLQLFFPATQKPQGKIWSPLCIFPRYFQHGALFSISTINIELKSTLSVHIDQQRPQDHLFTIPLGGLRQGQRRVQLERPVGIPMARVVLRHLLILGVEQPKEAHIAIMRKSKRV